MEEDPFDLDRFVAAQSRTYGTALGELRHGLKRSHWMWYVFPQIAGLGRTETSRYFAIRGAAEATAYLAHPLLGPRLRECTAAVLTHKGESLGHIFGWPDDVKFVSSMTLFAAVSEPGDIFEQALDTFVNGQRDPLTTQLLAVSGYGP